MTSTRAVLPSKRTQRIAQQSDSPRWWAPAVHGLTAIVFFGAVAVADCFLTFFLVVRIGPASMAAVASAMGLDLVKALPAGIVAWALCCGMLAVFVVVGGLLGMRLLWRAARAAVRKLDPRD